jgi:hypothetical protein
MQGLPRRRWQMPGFVELRLLTVVWALDRQDDDPSGIAEFGGE